MVSLTVHMVLEINANHEPYKVPLHDHDVHFFYSYPEVAEASKNAAQKWGATLKS
jgi:hypothetical protein